MDISQLRTFEMLVECGSFTQVSRELNISQPAVSNQILALERELGVKLLDRLPRRVILTSAGEVLHDYAHRMLNLEANARQSLAELAGQQESSLHLGASPTIAAYILPGLLAAFSRNYASFHVTAEVKPSFEIAAAVSDHSYDLGLVETEVEADDLIVTPFMVEEQVLVVSNKHPWAGRQQVEPDELTTQTFATREPGSATRSWIEQSLKQLGISITNGFELGDIEAIKNTVSYNLGIAFVSYSAVQNEVAAGILAKVDVRGVKFSRPLFSVCHRQRYLPPLASTWLEQLPEIAANLMA